MRVVDKFNRTIRWCDKQLEAGYSRWGWYRELTLQFLEDDERYFEIWLADSEFEVKHLTREIEILKSERAEAVEKLDRARALCT